MSYESKVVLLNHLKSKLSSELKASELPHIMELITDTINNYDITLLDPKPTQDDLLDVYISSLRVSGRSEKTIERYKYVITKLYNHVNIPTRDITVHHLRSYLSSEKQRGISDRTLEGTRQIFSSYFNWLHRESLISINPVANLGAIKYPKKIKQIYSQVDIEKMKFGCKSVRDRAIICFLFSTGCRISEMTGLNRNDINLESLECVVRGKGDKDRTVFFDSVTRMFLEEYLNGRDDEYDALFVGRGSERMTPAGVRKMLKVMSGGISVKGVHPHKFRRTLATNLIRHGMPIQEVASILGHDKLDTTMQYVVLDKSDVKNSYRKYL